MSPNPFTVPSLADSVRSIVDFPKPGIIYRDITTLLAQPEAFSKTVEAMTAFARSLGSIDKVVAAEARGFIFGAPLALALHAGFVPVRKQGKLPWKTKKISYQLEYGEDTLEIHNDAIRPGERLLLVDDLLATGGTISSICQLVESMGGEIVGLSFAIELPALQGRSRLAGYQVSSVMTFDGE